MEIGTASSIVCSLLLTSGSGPAPENGDEDDTDLSLASTVGLDNGKSLQFEYDIASLNCDGG